MMKIKTRLGILVIVLAFGLFSVACTTTGASLSGGADPQSSFVNVNIAGQSFSPVGLVFAETEIETVRRRDSRTVSGEVLTYQELLRQAHALGAHAIINVTIERVIEYNSTRTRFLFFTLADIGTTRETWKGSALAIVYTGSLHKDYHFSNVPAVPVPASGFALFGGGDGRRGLFRR